MNVFLLILRVIRAYRDNHEKHCSQISVSTYIHLKNKGHFNSAHTYSDTSIVHTHNICRYLIKVPEFMGVTDFFAPLVCVTRHVRVTCQSQSPAEISFWYILSNLFELDSGHITGDGPHHHNVCTL